MRHLATALIRRTKTEPGRHRRITLRRRALGGVAVAALVATPLSVVEIASGTAGATTANPDKVVFTQVVGNGNKNGGTTYFQYVPGDGSTVVKQSVTGGGGCGGAPTIGTSSNSGGTNAPLLNWAAGFSSSGYPTTWPPASGAVVSAGNGVTGVCESANLSGTYSIDNTNAQKVGVEALDFSTGTNSVDAGRPFSRAQIALQEVAGGTASVQLLETLAGQQVGSQRCTIGPKATLTTDTRTSTNVCTGTDPAFSGFDTVEVRVLTTNESVSVVQTSTFTLAGGKLCGGTPISTTSNDGSSSSQNVSVTLSLVKSDGTAAASTDCKPYSNFAASANMTDASLGTTKEAVFSGTGTSVPTGDHIVAMIDWGIVSTCRPDSNDSSNVCPPTYIQFTANGTPQPQTYCESAADLTSDTPWCTTSKTFTYENGGTDIQETWVGIGDPYIRTGP